MLVDLRHEEDVRAGHIARAVGIPAAKLADARNMFPSFGYKDVRIYTGGFPDRSKNEYGVVAPD